MSVLRKTFRNGRTDCELGLAASDGELAVTVTF